MIVPSLDAKYYEATVDIDFLKAVSKISADRRRGHRLYRDMMCKYMKNYADIIYNNTTIPVSAELSLWEEGKSVELAREKLHQRVYQEWNIRMSEKKYYKHYYSDFDSYSRFDSSWLDLFNKTIGNSNNPMYQMWFKFDVVYGLMQEHISGKNNNRKALCYLTSLALYMEMIENNTY